MSETLEQIFEALDAIGVAADILKSRAAAAGKQTDLEISILTTQLAELREKNARAGAKIDESLLILKALK